MRKSLFNLLLVFLFIGVVSAAVISEPSVCCEKTKEGATCINTEPSSCKDSVQSAPTSCETTSFCKLGTCYDSSEGICMDNTPQTTCEESGGIWDERESSEIPQCQLGCCILADQAAFVPLVRCKRLSSEYGVATDYRSDITNEGECIATAQSQDKGACVYESDFERVCKFTTRSDCNAQIEVEVTNDTISSKKTFYKDKLCSAEELGTSCAAQVSTKCYQGKVYWLDSCGNRENIFNGKGNPIEPISHHNGIVAEPEEICNISDGDDKFCGNCDYFQGSRCAESNSFSASEYTCQRTECIDRWENPRINGESWCVDPAEKGDKTSATGSRYFKETCIDGEIIVEPCADYRNEICIEGTIDTEKGEFTSAACRVNRWQDCILQDEGEDCENSDKRDCRWIPSVVGLLLSTEEVSSSKGSFSGSSGSFSNPTYTGNAISPITGNAILGGDYSSSSSIKTYSDEGICVPDFTPGFNFWEESDATGICSYASAKCTVVYEKGLLDSDWDCVEGCECLSENWALSINNVCNSLGDCGGGVNYIGAYSDEGYDWVGLKSASDGPGADKQKFSPSGRNKIKFSMTGFAITPSYIINDNLKLNAEGYVYVKSD